MSLIIEKAFSVVISSFLAIASAIVLSGTNSFASSPMISRTFIGEEFIMVFSSFIKSFSSISFLW